MGRPSKLHEHRGKWRCRIGGVEHEWDSEAEARAEFYTLMGQHLADKANPDKPQTVGGVVTLWLAVNSGSVYGRWLADFVEHAGRVHLSAVQRDTLTRYHIYLKGLEGKRYTYNRRTKKWTIKSTGKPLSPGTIKHYMATAKAVLAWAHKQGWIKTMPDEPRMPKPVRQPRDVEPGKLADTLDGLPKRAGDILRFIAATGCRPGEACKLEWEHVHLDAGLCILPAHKTAARTGKPRTIYLTPEATDILKALLPDIGTPTGPVFKSRFFKPYTSAGLRAILRGHGGFTPYQLRHSFAQSALDDQPMEVVAALLGHADLATVQTYCQIRDRRASAAAASIKPHTRAAAAG